MIFDQITDVIWFDKDSEVLTSAKPDPGLELVIQNFSTESSVGCTSDVSKAE